MQDDAPAQPGPRPKRIRLSPAVRRQQILDAALSEFSAIGFEGATLERIAQRVGLTKAGIYAHFSAKEDIFEALLVSTIFPQTPQTHWQWIEGSTLEETIDRFLDSTYPALADPRVQATFRLLIGESGRAPERIRRWHREIFLPHAQRRQAELDAFVAGAGLPQSAITRKFALASAPVLLAMVTQLLIGGEEAAREIAELRDAHREMLLILFAGGGAR